MKLLANTLIVMILIGMVVLPIMFCDGEKHPRLLTFVKFGAILAIAVAAALILD